MLRKEVSVVDEENCDFLTNTNWELKFSNTEADDELSNHYGMNIRNSDVWHKMWTR